LRVLPLEVVEESSVVYMRVRTGSQWKATLVMLELKVLQYREKDHVVSSLLAEMVLNLKSLLKKQVYQVDSEVYWRRWLMLFYMSLLNLLSDWTCSLWLPSHI
jgi:hypothetical protein